jgi:predicted site-specific integrase-resolvase
MKMFVRAAEASEILGVHPVTLRRWAVAGLIETIKVGQNGKRRYRVASVIKPANMRDNEETTYKSER